MLRAYQQSATSRGAHDSTGPWTLKDRSDIDPSIRGRTVSTHILGLGIVLVGVLFMAVGLIMGFEFPKYVYEKNKEAQCVLHSQHENYRTWRQGTQWSRKVKLYYWTLQNKQGFLYNDDKPQFRQKGPYVYIAREVKTDIRFAVTEVFYRTLNGFVFDNLATLEECQDCREFEQITILSPWYQELLNEHGGENGLACSYVPVYIISTLVKFGLATNDHGSITFRANITVLGEFQSSDIVMEAPLSDFSFGTWFNSWRSNSFKSTVEANTVGGSFSEGEIRAMYRVFTNETLLLGRSFSNSNNDMSSDSRSVHKQNCDRWAESICSSSSNSYSSSVAGVGLSECGIAPVLLKCHTDNGNIVYSSSVISLLSQTFCPEDGDFCLNFTNMSQVTAYSYTASLSEFLLNLSSNVLDLVLGSQQTNIVISRNQSELALGFQTETDISGKTISYQGFLEKFRTGDDTYGGSNTWKTYTCLQNRNMGNNMKLKEYGGRRTVPDSLLKPGSPHVSLESQTDFTSACSLLRACVSCAAQVQILKVFAEDLMRPVTFYHNGVAEYRDVDMQRYTLINNSFTNDSNILAADGFQDLTSLTGYLSWASLPQETTDAFDILNLQPLEPSQLLVESVTGKVWKRTFRWQMNIGLNPSSAHLGRWSINAVAQGVPLPVFWVEKVAEISDDEVGDYKHLVARLMAVSCGGLIGFSIIAVVTAIIGVIICVYPSKPNRVLPMADDAPSSASGTRHP